MTFNRIPIGEILINMKLIDESQLSKALALQKEHKHQERIGSILVRQGFITLPVLLKVLAEQQHIPKAEALLAQRRNKRAKIDINSGEADIEEASLQIDDTYKFELSPLPLSDLTLLPEVSADENK